MTRYSRKKSLQTIIFSSTSLSLIGLFIVILISIPLVKNIKKQLNVNEEISTLNQEIVDLEKRNTELKDLISYLNSDQFTEEQARLNLDYKKEGEKVVIIKGDDTEQANSPALKSVYSIKGLGTDKEAKIESNVNKWINYFWN